MPDTIQIRLPEANREDYLAWMGYWREVEHVMFDYPRLAELARSESAPFVREPIADYISHEVIPQIIREAADAPRDSLVSPVLDVRSAPMERAVEYVARRTQWLSQPGVHEALGIVPLPGRIIDLKIKVLIKVREQLATQQARRSGG